MLAESCIFCKIIRGEIPSQKVFENDEVLAFLDINPLSTGHTVVIPKRHAERLADLDEDWNAALGRVIGRLSKLVVSVVAAEGHNVLQNDGAVAGQVVPHVHYHIVPRWASDGLGYRWNAKSANADELTQLAQRIRAAL